MKILFLFLYISVETSVISSDKVKMGLTSVEWVEGESSTKLNGMNFFFTFTNQGDSDVIFGNNHPEWKRPVIIAN